MIKKYFKSFDEKEIPYLFFESSRNDFNNNIVILHGMVEHVNRYEEFGHFLSVNGYNVYIIEIRGHGELRDNLFGDFGKRGIKEVFYDIEIFFNELSSKNGISRENTVIFGHSMGGHGALMIALRNPQRYASVSAFSPIVAPSQVPWGQKAFSAYLGDDQSTWANYDSLALMKQSAHSKKLPLLIDQGSGDEFLAEQLKPELFAQAAKDANYPMTLRMQDGYDHSYYFISSFIADHFAHHAAALQA